MNKNDEFTGYLANYAKIGMEDFDDLISGANLDKQSSRPHHEAMNSPTREEIDAKLETMEVRMDARVASIESKLDVFLTKVDGDKETLRLLAQQAADAATRSGGLKTHMWISTITTVLAVMAIAATAYFGNQASNQSIVQTTLSAYQAGRSDSQSSIITTNPTLPQPNKKQ